jgi:hypothetical protein
MMKNARIWNDMSSIGVMINPRLTPATVDAAFFIAILLGSLP